MAEKRYLDEDGLTLFNSNLIAYINGASSNSIKSAATTGGNIYFFKETPVPMSGAYIDTSKAAFIVAGGAAVQVADNLTTMDGTKALSAKQGVLLSNDMSDLETQIDELVVNNFTTDDATRALSASKGKYLYDNMPVITKSTVDIGEGAPLDANTIYIVYE